MGLPVVDEGVFFKVMDGMRLTDNAPSPIRVTIDGREMAFDQAPIIENGRALVPLRAIFEALGAEVSWDVATRTVNAAKGADTVSLQIGNVIMTKNGIDNTLEVAPKLLNSRTLVPIRAVSESLGAHVDWDGANRVVTIKT